MIKLEHTSICAVARLRANNNTSISEITELMSSHELTIKKTWTPDYPGGETAIICTTTPGEESLVESLRKIGFNCIAEVPRRNGYPAGRVKIWIYIFTA
jgi:hypothetical protein